MRLDGAAARDRFAAARIGRLATADAQARPHIVPIVFVLDAEVVYTAIDWKPKKSSQLRRLTNIADNPTVSILVDHYDDDWARLWWARADGTARVLDADDAAAAQPLLAAKYPQYQIEAPPGPIIAIDVERWSGWSADG